MLISEERFFQTCLDIERKDIMTKALDTYLDKLEDIQASRMSIQEVRRLKEEIDKTKICSYK